MDSVTQAALGATLGGAIMGPRIGRYALLGGALLGTLPDLDVLVDYGSAVDNFTQHRGFSHSVIVLFPLAIILALALHRWRPLIPRRRWMAFTSLPLLTHPVLDCFTTYGTQIFWPFGEPISIGSLFIIDPLYTLPLVVALGWTLFRPEHRRALYVGLALSTLYIGWSLAAQQLITKRVMPALAERGLERAPRLVQPMPLSTLLWRVTVLGEQQRLEIVTGFLDNDDPVTAETFARQPQLKAIGQRFESGRQLHRFTDGFLSYQRVGLELHATDIRLGLPGAHPFTFVIAEQRGSEWVDAGGTRVGRINPEFGLIIQLGERVLGDKGALCLTSLDPSADASQCR
jgi:inner membrane protein